MYKEFVRLIKQATIYGMADITPKAIGFFLIPVYTRCLTPVDYGVQAMIMLLLSFSGSIFLLGMSQGFYRLYFEGTTEKEKGTIYFTALVAAAFLGCIGMVVYAAFASQISLVLFSTVTHAYYVKCALVMLFCQIVKAIPFSVVVARGRSGFYLCMNIANFLIGLALNIYLIVVLKLGVQGWLYSAMCVEVISALALIAITLPRQGIGFSFKWLKEMMRYGFPLIFSWAFSFCYMASDRFFLEKFYSLAAVGLYALSLQFGELLTYAAAPFSTAYSPLVLSSHKEKHAKQMFARFFTYFFLVLCFLALGLSVYIRDILSIVASKTYWGAYKLVPILAVGTLFRMSYGQLILGITITKKTKFNLYVNAIAAAMNILLLLFLVPRLGPTGAAVSRAVTFLILAILGNKISQRLFYIKYERKRIAQMAVLALGLYIISTFVPTGPFFLSLVLKGMLVLFYPLCLLGMGFFDPDEKRRINALLRMKKVVGQPSTEDMAGSL